MENKFLKITSRNEWQSLLNKVLFKTFFHNLEWEEFLERNFKWISFERYLYKDEALLSLAKVKIFGKEKLISHPFCEYGGPLPLVDKIDFQKFQEDLFSEFRIPLKISLHPSLLSHFSNVPRSDLGTSRVSYFLEEFPPLLRKTTRHEIKKAQNQDLKIEKCQTEKELKELYNLYLRASKRHRVPAYPFSFFQYFFNSPQAEIILAEYQNRIVAGSIFLFYDVFCHYFLNAVDEKFKNSGANYLVLWSKIQKRNYQIFDFGGTRKDSSLEIFKRGWGGKEYPIYELTNQKKENKLRQSKLRNLFSLLPPFLIKKLSPYLLKYKL